jgi:hypothetical protein
METVINVKFKDREKRRGQRYKTHCQINRQTVFSVTGKELDRERK